MIKPELFDLVELLVDLPEHNLIMGEQGTIVEEYNDGFYEIEFSNDLIVIHHPNFIGVRVRIAINFVKC